MPRQVLQVPRHPDPVPPESKHPTSWKGESKNPVSQNKNQSLMSHYLNKSRAIHKYLFCMLFRKNAKCPESTMNYSSKSKGKHFSLFLALTSELFIYSNSFSLFQLHLPSPQTQSASTAWCPGRTTTGKPAASAPT